MRTRLDSGALGAAPLLLLLAAFARRGAAYVTSRRAPDGRVEQVLRGGRPAAAESLDEENAAQLEMLEAQLRAEMGATAPPPFPGGVGPAGFNAVAGPNFYRPFGQQPQALSTAQARPAPTAAAAFGPPARAAKTLLNFDMLQDCEHDLPSSKVIDADLQKFRPEQPDRSTAFIDSNIAADNRVLAGPPGLLTAPGPGPDPTPSDGAGRGEDVFVDALKRVLFQFKRDMMRGKFGADLQHKAERLSRDGGRHDSRVDDNRVDEPAPVAGGVADRPYLSLRKKWGHSGRDGRFAAAEAAEFRHKPAARGVRQLSRVFAVLPSRSSLAN